MDGGGGRWTTVCGERWTVDGGGRRWTVEVDGGGWTVGS